MFRWAINFAVIALIASLLGFGGDPGDAVLSDKTREMAIPEQGAGKVVEPDLLAVLADLEQRIHR